MDEKYPNFSNLVPYIEKPDKEVARKKSVFTQEEIDDLMNWLGEMDYSTTTVFVVVADFNWCKISELERFETDIIDENNTAFDGFVFRNN